MSEPTHPTPRPEGPPDRRIRRAWWIFATSFFCLCLIAVLRLALDTAAADRRGPGRPHRPRRVRRDPPSRGGRRPRGRTARGGGVVRPDPVRPVAVGVARRDPRRHRRRAGRCDGRRPHRHRPPPARRPRPRGDPGQRPPGRARLDDAPADRRPRGSGAGRGRGGRPRAGRHPRRRRGRASPSPRADSRTRIDGLTSRIAAAGPAPGTAAVRRRRDGRGTAGGRRPDRPARPPGLRPDRHARRAADLVATASSAPSSCRDAARAAGRPRPGGSWPVPPSRRRPPCRARTRTGRPRRRPRPTP